MLSTALGVAIGIVFVFMLFSLFLSAALEAVAAAMKLRGRALQVAIARLIDDAAHRPRMGGFGLLDAAWPSGRVTSSEREAPLVAEGTDEIAPERHEAITEASDGDFRIRSGLSLESVYRHPLVAGSDSRPSYVASINFASALLRALTEGAPERSFSAIKLRVESLPPGPLREALQTGVDEAGGSVDRLRDGIERWYNHAMDRLSGEYKRFSQAATFLVGLVLALAYQIDSIGLAQRFYVDPLLREATVNQATRYVEDHGAAMTSGGGASAPDFGQRIQALKEARDALLVAAPFASGGVTAVARQPGEWTFQTLLGCFLTALAGMLGAPFWFDLLQKLVSLRGTGPKPPPPTVKTGEPHDAA